MNRFAFFLKAAAALGLASTLTACFDMELDVNVTGVDTVAATMTMSVSKQVADMAQIKSADSTFCDGNGQITETDTAIVCTETKEGSFADVFPAGASGEPQPTIEDVGSRQVKVTFPTSDLNQQLGGGGTDSDEQTKAMMKQMFAGHAITIKVSGGTIVDTNMTKAEDGQSAQLVINLEELVTGTVSLPDKAYAVVQLP